MYLCPFLYCIYVGNNWFEDRTTEQADRRMLGLPASWHLHVAIIISKYKSTIKNSNSDKYETDFYGVKS